MRARVRALHVESKYFMACLSFSSSLFSRSLYVSICSLYSLSLTLSPFFFFVLSFLSCFLLVIYFPIFLSFSLFLCLSVCLSIHPFISLSIYLFSFHFSTFFALSVLSSFCQFLFRERTCTNITKLPMFLIKPNTATFLLFYFYILTAAVFHFNCFMLGQPMYQSRQLQDPLALCFIIALGRFASQVQLKLPFHLSVARGL